MALVRQALVISEAVTGTEYPTILPTPTVPAYPILLSWPKRLMADTLVSGDGVGARGTWAATGKRLHEHAERLPPQRPPRGSLI